MDSRSCWLSAGVSAVFSGVFLPPAFNILLTGDFDTRPFSCAALKILRR